MQERWPEIRRLVRDVDWSAPSSTKQDPVREQLAGLLKVPVELVRVYYVGKPGNFTVRFTQVGATKNATQRGFAVLPQGTDPDTCLELARELIRTSDAYDSIGFFSPDADGQLHVPLVVSPRDSGVYAVARDDYPAARHALTSDEGLGDLLPDKKSGRVWVEFAHRDVRGNHEGWRIGQVLWSPARSESGADIYSNMREAKPGDLVIHVVDRELAGVSRVRTAFREQVEEPPHAEQWAKRGAYYVINLEGYTEVRTPFPLARFLEENADAIRKDMEAAPAKYPFQESGKGPLQAKLNGYLYECSGPLYGIIRKALSSGSVDPEMYGIAHALEGSLIAPESLRAILDMLALGRNVLLQGPPGTGKTYLAKRLAYAHIGRKDPSRVTVVQFHQSYSYEDFIRGWRPSKSGGFELRDGVFKSFCDRARATDGNFVFIIDEINRGNLSKILGETLLLIEPDKRGDEFGLPLAYRESEAERFSVPPNVRLIGLMNTADRSLAMVDYALRRRFSFFDCRPEFGDRFLALLTGRGVDSVLATEIAGKVTKLNEAIRADRRNLGPGYEVGHSFFCTPPNPASHEWFDMVVKTEIAPLLREYWFDAPQTAEEWTELLLK